ncbi:MAG: assimilatory sulfite reductase (NADPH) flavoprotein subunit [Wenzhouxiangellaceae bacterium]|nr:assimilatory sulfite reductase (NADPH) flavoprotein subunit [Wenzhouxiangellaceae bacterium]
MAVSPRVTQDIEQQLGGWADGLGPDQLVWASGFLAGLAVARESTAAPDQDKAGADRGAERALTIWFGSETGNGRGVAERLAAAARAKGFAVDLASTADIEPRSISRISLLLLVISTHGEGDPPDDAQALHKLICSSRAPALEHLQYAVFALGDSSYPDFCQTGRDFDARLQVLGAKPILERTEVDIDFESAEDAWRARIVDKLEADFPAPAEAAPHLQLIGKPPAGPQLQAQAPVHDRRKPFDAEVLEVAALTVAPSSRPVHHVELQVQGSGLAWSPGDSLGLWPTNDRRLVDEIIEVSGIDAGASVARGEQLLSARDWLSHRLELTQLTQPFIKAWADISESGQLLSLLEDRGQLAAWVATRQVIDVLRQYPARVDADGLLGALRGIAPRLYSIASSRLANEDEIHITVKRVGGFDADGRLRAGVASWQLSEAVSPGDRLPVYVQANPRFRLPDDASRPIIMIGPGTGVAPFRAFLQQRQALGQPGHNWLFFGARHRSTDFLYQLEWQRFQRQDGLQRLSVAFSRDQADKIYVQHRLREQGRDVYDWLEQGAHVYVCGDGQAMAADVHAALLDIIGAHGGMPEDKAAGYLEAMKTENRYQKDTY